MFLRVGALRFLDYSEKTVVLVRDSSGEIQSLAQEEQVPQTVKIERRAVLLGQRSHESAGARIINVDSAVAKISDEQIVLERIKISRRHRQSPRRIEHVV